MTKRVEVSAPKKSCDKSMFFVLEGYKHAFFTIDKKIICMPFDFDLNEMDLDIRDLEAPIVQANRMAFNKLRILDESGTLTTVAIMDSNLQENNKKIIEK